jgi:uncharacterized damage-inducible protein DinB
VNRRTLEALFDYDGWAFQRFTETIKTLPAGTLEKPARGSGWPALRNCLGHIANGYGFWLERVDGKPFEPPDLESADLPAIEAHYQYVRDRFRAYFDSLSDEELMVDRDVDVHGDMVRYPPAVVLGHVLAHSRAHHGDLGALFFQVGVEEHLPLVDYRYYFDARR